MRRKLLAILLSTACVLLAAGCGSAGSESAASTEVAGAAQEADTQDTEATESAETGIPEGEETATSEEQEEPELKVISWYMDKEGAKSDEFGMMISRDNGIMDVTLNQHMMVWGDSRGTQLNFTCSYYDGTLDNYIVQNPGYEKGTWGEYEYAYSEDENFSDFVEVAFVGNGVALEGGFSISDLLEDESIDEYLTRANVQGCDEFAQDCLAYLTEDGLYSPALALSVTYNEDGTSEYGRNEIDSQSVRCSNYSLYSGDEISRSLKISSDSYQNNTSFYGMGEAESAQEALEIYVASCMEPSEYKTVEHTELEGTVETAIAGHPYLGRGISSRWKDDASGSMDYEWLFCSDDIAWTIWIDTEEETYEPCLSVIETMP